MPKLAKDIFYFFGSIVVFFSISFLWTSFPVLDDLKVQIRNGTNSKIAVKKIVIKEKVLFEYEPSGEPLNIGESKPFKLPYVSPFKYINLILADGSVISVECRDMKGKNFGFRRYSIGIYINVDNNKSDCRISDIYY
jgi:hypothetical protein